MPRLRLALWAAVCAWAAGLAVALAVRVGLPHLPLLTPAQAATAADAGVRLAPTAGGASARTLRLATLEPGGGSGSVQLGARVTMLDFFATWCHACALDMATMKKYQRLAPRDGLPPLVAVDLRVAEPSTAYVRRFARAAGLTFPVALDSAGKASDAFAVGVLPTVVLVGRGGAVLWRHTGLVDLRTLVAAARAHATSG